VGQHRTYPTVGLRRRPLSTTRPARHRSAGPRPRRVPVLGPVPGRHRRTALARARRPRRLSALAIGVLAGVTAVSGWFAASGAVAMAAMVR
jgi:hypothetical protein